MARSAFTKRKFSNSTHNELKFKLAKKQRTNLHTAARPRHPGARGRSGRSSESAGTSLAAAVGQQGAAVGVAGRWCTRMRPAVAAPTTFVGDPCDGR